MILAACLGALLAMTFGTLAQAQPVTSKPSHILDKIAGLNEKEARAIIEDYCTNPPLSAAPVPREYVNLCGHRTAPTHLPSTLVPEVPRGPLLTQDAGHAATGLGTSSVATIGTLTSFGALVIPDFPADLELLQGDSQNVYQLTGAGVSSRYNSAGANSAMPNIAPPAGQTWADLAVDPTTGTVYAVTTVCGTSSTLSTVNLTAGTTAVVGPILATTCIVALAADNAGNLFGLDIVADNLIAINKVTGVGTIVGLVGFNANFGQSMDCDPGDGTCYLFTINATNSLAELRSVNTGTGASTLIGTIGAVSPGGAVQLSGAVFGTIGLCTVDADCSDGNPCNGAETCVASNCSPGTPTVCPDDGLFCTLEACNPGTGLCVTSPNSCADGNACTTDTCVEATDTCTHTSPTPVQFCNAGSITIGTGSAVPYPSTIAVSGLGSSATLCSVELKAASHTWPGDIDMMLVGPAGGAQNRTIWSDVGGSTDIVAVNVTLTDSAAAGMPTPIVSGTFKPTNTGAADAFPAPAPAPTGLAPLSPVFDNINPNGNWSLYIVDDSAGDTGAIAQGWCVNIVVNGCTVDADCADGNLCNGAETCVNNICVPGAPVDCNDNDVCTTDNCIPQTGLCDHPAVVCNDINPCTTDTCIAPATGCDFAPNTLPCEDGNPCTSNDQCGGGSCNSGPSNPCDDSNTCTADACDALIGCYHSAASGGGCDDGNPCTDGDTCALPCTGAFAENFDGVVAPALPAGWTTQLITGIAGDIAWRTAASADTAPNGGNTDDPSHVTDKVLVAPALPAGATQVTFRKSFVLEGTSPNFFDGAVLEIKLGAGAFQDIITAGGSFVVGGYTGAISTAFSSPIAGRQAWSGASAAFSTTTVDLPPAAQGQNVILRWRVATDSSVSGTGFTVDTITATTCASNCNPGAPVGSPSEVTGDTFALDKQTFSWAPAVAASRYDIVRGRLELLPVGPGGDESCFPDVIGTSLVDGLTPPAGFGNWYLVRGDNACAPAGTYGTQSNLTPRITTACP